MTLVTLLLVGVPAILFWKRLLLLVGHLVTGYKREEAVREFVGPREEHLRYPRVYRYYRRITLTLAVCSIGASLVWMLW